MAPEEIGTHFHGDGCKGGHWRVNQRTGAREQCVHETWTCDHCHDDPAEGHVCPSCGVRGSADVS